jgi:hypothetical protein
MVQVQHTAPGAAEEGLGLDEITRLMYIFKHIYMSFFINPYGKEFM